jgi:hypothetical protein
MDYALDGMHTQTDEPRITTAAIRRANLLLAALPSADHRKLIARCEPVELAFGDVICEQGERISHVYFPIESFVSHFHASDNRCNLPPEAGRREKVGRLPVDAPIHTHDFATLRHPPLSSSSQRV